MKNSIIVKNGLYGAAFLLVVNLLMLAFLGTDPSNFDISEIIGYSTITLSLIFVFLGIRQYELGASASNFLTRLGIGAGISLFPSLLFGLYNVVYVKWIDPDFNQKYADHMLGKMQASMSASEFELAKEQMLQDQALFENVGFQFFLMFLTVFIIGLIISILSSLYFQLKPVKR